MWARRGDLGYHSPGQTSGGYPYRGLITKLRHLPARVPTSDSHKLRLSCRGVAGIPPVDPRVIVYESMYSGCKPARTAASGNGETRLYMGPYGRLRRMQLLSLGGIGKLCCA